jgi:hypothetical protein
MVCRYCGLETGSGGGHRSQAECIRALNDEIARAKQLIDRTHDERGRSASPNQSLAARARS